MQRVIKIVVVGLLVGFLAGLYWYGAEQQLTKMNRNMDLTDQSAYMEYARKLHESGYDYAGGRNRMPVYPFIQSLFYEPNLSEEDFFVRGKYINLILSMLLLGGIALLLYRYFHWLHTLNLMLITAFLIFIFKAGWFQAELFFYFINFCLFLLMWTLLQRPSWGLALVTGIVAGIAHLTKASILPGLAIFLVLAGVKWTLAAYRQWRAGAVDQSPLRLSRYVFLAPVVAIVFLATVYPYISTSKRIYGQYFYNVNSTFYIWYDSWEEAKAGTRAHGDREGWPDMPADQIPSMSKYLEEHSTREIVQRFVTGGELVMEKVIGSFGYFKFFAIYAGMLGIAVLWQWRRARDLIRDNVIVFLFAGAYFTVYILLYFWYAHIASGPRLILAQFLPLMFVISIGLHALLRDTKVRISRFRIDTLTSANLVILGILILEVYAVVTHRAGSLYGGD